MKVLWITLNLAGATLIIGGAIYSMNHKTTFPFVMAGMASLAISNVFRARVFRNR